MTATVFQALKLIQSPNWKTPAKRDAAPPAEKNIVIDGVSYTLKQVIALKLQAST